MSQVPHKKSEPISDSVRLALIERRIANIEKTVKSTGFWIKVRHISSIIFTIFIAGFMLYSARLIGKQLSPAFKLIEESQNSLNNLDSLVGESTNRLEDLDILMRGN